MMELSKQSLTPTTYFALAFCTHVIAFVILMIGMFTPYWSQITEQVAGTSDQNVVYFRGLIITCTPDQSCTGITNFSQVSGVYFAAFVLAIISVVHAVFVIQLFCAGLFIKSCRESNLGVPVAALSILQGILLMLVLVLYEISASTIQFPGNIFRKDMFGFSRGLVVGSMTLYFLAGLFIVGEYMMRIDRMTATQRSRKETKEKGRTRKSHRDERSHRESRRKKVDAAGPLPPPYTRGNPVYNPDPEERYYSPANGMRPCKLPGCEMCSFVTGSPTFWGPAGVFNINDRLTCQANNVVYAIICVKDDKVFIGHSNRRLVDTVGQHLENIKTKRVNDPVAFHFTQTGHSALDLRVSALARINCSSETRSRLEKALSYDMDRPHNSYYGINDDFEFL